MSLQNRQIKKHIGIIGAICGSLVLGMPAIAQAGMGDADSTPGTRSGSSDSQLNRPSGSQSDRLSDAERDRLCANYVNETATNRDGNPVPRDMRQNETLGTNRAPGSSVDRAGATTGSTTGTSRITQSLPTGRVNESPEVRDGRFRNQTSANAREICANYMRERGINRDTPTDRQGDSPSRNQNGSYRDLNNTPPGTQSDTPARDLGGGATDTETDRLSEPLRQQGTK